MGRLTASVVEVPSLGAPVTDRLYDLFTRYYGRSDRATFDRDLAEKGWVLLLSDEAGAIQGFTTIMLLETELEGRRLRAAFSGNTIIDRSFWGEQELVRSWCRFLGELRLAAPDVPLYWFLICSGYRTYLYLPLFFETFYPRGDRPTPPFEGALIDHLGRLKFPEEYRDGVVRVREPRECLRPDLAVPLPRKLENPHIRFFFERNPGSARGDELVCVTRIDPDNMKRLARSAVLEAGRAHAEVPAG